MLTYVIRRLLYSTARPLRGERPRVLGHEPRHEPDRLPQDAAEHLRSRRSRTSSERKHLDEPIYVRYGYWVKDMFTNKFGTETVSDLPIWPDLQRAFGHTLQLVIAAEIIAILLADRDRGLLRLTPVQRLRLRRDDLQLRRARDTRLLARADAADPVREHLLKWFDVRIFYVASLNSVDPGTGIHFVLDRAQHLALPIIVLAVANIATYSRFMRASMLEVVNSDYVRTARAKGLEREAGHDEARVSERAHSARHARRAELRRPALRGDHHRDASSRSTGWASTSSPS